MRKNTLSLVLIGLLFLPTAYADSFIDGLTAYRSNNYATAMRIFRPLGEQGNVKSQRYLGEMYDKGRGVLKDHKEAVKWFKLAAEQSDPPSQYYLGLKYANGHGVKENATLAYVWFAISFDNGYEAAADPLRVLNKSLSMEKRQIALKMAAQKMKQLAGAQPKNQ